MTNESMHPEHQEQPKSRITTYIRQPLSSFQALVGLLTGFVAICGALLTFDMLSPVPAKPQGEIVAFVQDARSRKPVADAKVEIFTAQNTVVTMVTVQADGRITRPVKAGTYRLRVSHPNFDTEVRQIQVQAGQRSDVRVALALPPKGGF